MLGVTVSSFAYLLYTAVFAGRKEKLGSGSKVGQTDKEVGVKESSEKGKNTHIWWCFFHQRLKIYIYKASKRNQPQAGMRRENGLTLSRMYLLRYGMYPWLDTGPSSSSLKCSSRATGSWGIQSTVYKLWESTWESEVRKKEALRTRKDQIRADLAVTNR